MSIYLVNNMCYDKWKLKAVLEKYIYYKEMSALAWSKYAYLPLSQDDIIIHVWNDSPFSYRPFLNIFNYNPKNSFYVVYIDAQLMEWNHKQLDEHAKKIFGNIYSDEERNHHIFFICSDTNEGMDKLVDAVRRVQH